MTTFHNSRAARRAAKKPSPNRTLIAEEKKAAQSAASADFLGDTLFSSKISNIISATNFPNYDDYIHSARWKESNARLAEFESAGYRCRVWMGRRRKLVWKTPPDVRALRPRGAWRPDCALSRVPRRGH